MEPLLTYITLEHTAEILLNMYYFHQMENNIYTILLSVGEDFLGPMKNADDTYNQAFVDNAKYIENSYKVWELPPLAYSSLLGKIPSQ